MVLQYDFKLEERDEFKEVRCYLGDKLIAKFTFSIRCGNCGYGEDYCACNSFQKGLWIQSKGIEVHENHRMQGIASTIYRLAELKFGLRVFPDGKSTSDGSTFRTRYEAKYGHPRTGVLKTAEDSKLPNLIEVAPGTFNQKESID